MDYVKIFERNIAAIKNFLPATYTKLETIKENRNFQANIKPNKKIDIVDVQKNISIQNESDTNIDSFLSLKEYPNLYFFGFGDGSKIKNLLKNPKHSIVVIEPEAEILFIALHCEDFSQEISSKRLTIFFPEDLNFPYLVEFLNQDIRVYYARSYNLHFASSYYESNYLQTIIETNTLIIRAFEFIITNSGNDIKDALMGVEHHIYNIPRLVAGTQFEKFKKQKNADTVIMVSTGPSLTKQLPLLKSIQDHATIICADSALRILYANDITPDICVSLERIPYVAELFRDLPKEYKQKTIFIRASLEHKDVFETLEGCQDILVMRPYKYNLMFGLEPYGILCSGTSVANMAHELCAFMGYKTCIIIGQDLAYGKGGITHSKGHILGEKDSSINAEEKIEIPAYGGKGTVYTNNTWQLFRNGLIQTINATSSYMLTINATQGGARIDGATEMSFKKAINKYIDKKLIKYPIVPQPTPIKEAKKYFNASQKNIKIIVKEGRRIQKALEKTFLHLAKVVKKLENKTQHKQLQLFNDKQIINLLTIISDTREFMEENLYYRKFFWELMQSIVVHYELELANIKIMAVNSPEENKRKALRWIYNHSHYFYTLSGAMDGVLFTIEKAQKESLDELPEYLNFLIEK